MYAFLAFPKMGEFQILAIPLVSHIVINTNGDYLRLY
jgi:hypothetical protein